MFRRLAFVAAAVALSAAVPVEAQQPAPPSFAPSNLTPAGVRSLAANCAGCHGTNGRPAAGSKLEGLAGKPRGETLTTLKDFREGKRPTVMNQLAKGYSDEELAALADYFAKQPR